MPGRLLPGTQSQTKTMGLYRLTIPEVVQESLNPKGRNGSTSFKSQLRPRYLGDVYRDLPLDAGPSGEPSFSSDDDYSVVSSVFTASSTRTTTSSSTDDDSVLLDFASRAGSLDHGALPAGALPKRHSTACCTDMAYRRELRKRHEHLASSALQQPDMSSFAMSLSFRRELVDDVGDDVDQNLALWEETSTEYTVRPAASVRNVQPAPHSWHAGDTAASSGSSRNKSAKSSSSKKKSFFNGLLSGLSFSTSRKLRKSAS